MLCHIKSKCRRENGLTEVYIETQQLTKDLETEKRDYILKILYTLRKGKDWSVEITPLKHKIEDLGMLFYTKKSMLKMQKFQFLELISNLPLNNLSIEIDKEYVPTKHCLKVKTQNTSQPSL